ncbi:MAG: threonine/serine dehydratase [bacterium]|nr:threonine/serine dehydratase [bacterium]
MRQEVEAAAKRIAGRVRLTPVETSPALAEAGARTVWLKLENLQLTGSFKLRGATNKILSLSEDERERGVVAASSGNHGAAVACAAAAAGCRALVFVPEGAAGSKVAAIRSWGAEVRSHGNDSLLAEIEARRHAAVEGMTYLSPYNDPAVVAGQGTLGAELVQQIERLDAVFLALGGGGLIGGVGGYLKSVWPSLRVIACSPENSPVMHASLKAGKILEMESLPTLSDGTAGGVETGAITFALCREIIDESWVVSEDEIREALKLILGSHHTLVEGAAGVAVAGYLANRERFAGMNVAIVLCGANIDLGVLKEIL